MRKRLKILYLFIMFGAIIFSYSNVAYASDCQDVSDCYGSIEAGIDVAAAMTYLLAGMMLYAEIVTFFLAPEIAIPIIIAKGTYEFGSGKDLYKSWADNANFKDTHRHAYTEEQLKLSWMERVIGVLPLATVIGLEAREMSEAWQLSKEMRLAEEASNGVKETETVEEVVNKNSNVSNVTTQSPITNLDNALKNLKNINPKYGEKGYNYNCVKCAIATDATLDGRLSSATQIPDEYGGMSSRILSNYFKQPFEKAKSYSEIENIFSHLPDGSRGIVTGVDPEVGSGHAFNVVKLEGKVHFLDGQTGREYIKYPYKILRFLRTK